MTSFLRARVAWPRSQRLALACLVVLTGWPATASADDEVVTLDGSEEPPPPAPPREEKDWTDRRELAVSVRHGIFIDRHAAGLSIGADVLHRRGLLVLGVVGEYGTTGFAPYAYQGGGAALGVVAPSPSWLRLELLGVAGAHAYAHVGALPFPRAAAVLGYFSDEGSSAVLPFAGARLRSSVELGASKRFAIGLEVLAEEDLTRVRRSYEVTMVAPGYRDVTVARRRVGGERLAAALTIGATFDL